MDIKTFLTDHAWEGTLAVLILVLEFIRRKLGLALLSIPVTPLMKHRSKEVTNVLAILSGKLEADRAHFHRFNNDKSEIYCTHEVTRIGIEGYIHRRTRVKAVQYQPFISEMREKGYAVFTDIHSLTDQNLVGTLVGKGIISVAMYIVTDNEGNEIGYIDVEYIRKHLASATPDMLKHLKNTAGVVGHLISR